MIICHHPTQPLPNPLLRIELWRISWLWHQHQATLARVHHLIDGSSSVVRSPIMNQEDFFVAVISTQLLEEIGEMTSAQSRTNAIVSLARQRRYRPVDLHLGMVISRGHFWNVIDETPSGCQRGMTSHRGLINKQELPVLWPLRKYDLQIDNDGRLFHRLRSQATMA